MSLTVANVITEFDKRIGDSSTSRISSAERLAYITQGTSWLQTRLLNDHQVKKYDFNYFDGIHYYKTTTVLDDLLEGNDLNTKVLEDDGAPFVRKSSQELRAEIGQGFSESSYSIERRDGDSYLLVNHTAKYPELVVTDGSSLTASGGTWAVDSTNSDATNLAVDTEDFSTGSASFSFDVDVSQSANNKATIYNSGLDSEDLEDEKDIASWIVEIKMPSVTYTSSFTLLWGSSTSDYYSVTVTSDYNSNSFVAEEYMTLKFDWNGASVTGTPDDTAINYVAFTINYSASQADETSFNLDSIRLIRPEKLSFYYTSYSVGTDTNGTDLVEYGATTDVPYYSGQYDHYKYIVADYAASACLRDLRLFDEADRLESKAERAIKEISNIIPKSMTREMKSFKPHGVNFRKTGRRGSRITKL